MKEEFKDFTCFIIAHRINTILDSDRIMVMDNGEISELDTPGNLLANPHSAFSGFVTEWENSHS